MPSQDRWRRSRTTTSSISEAPPRSSRARRDARLAAGAASGQAQHVAVLGDQHPVRREARLGREPRVLREHAVLAVDGHQVAGPRELQQLDEVVAAAVAGDVDPRRAGVHHVAAASVEIADQARDAALVAGDRARRENGRVARPGRQIAVLAEADHRERRERLALAARDEHERARGERVAEIGGVEPRDAAELQQAQVERRLGVVDHAAAEERDRPARRGGEPGHVLDARHRGREARDEHAPARARERLLEGGHHGVLAGRVPGLLDVGAIGEQRQHAAVAPLRECRDVGALVQLRPRVDLEVAARQHHAGGRLDRERQAVDDAVRYADRVDAEGSDLDGVAASAYESAPMWSS